MCISLKLHYTKFDVSRLFCSIVIEEKPLEGSARPPPPPLGKGRVKFSFLVVWNKSARIHWNNFIDSLMKSSKSEKTQNDLVPMSRQEKLETYFSCSLPDLKHDQKRFIRILSLTLFRLGFLPT